MQQSAAASPGGDGPAPYVEPGRAGRPRRRIPLALLSAVAIAGGLSVLPGSSTAGSNTYGPSDRFSCRASLARLGPVAGTGAMVEPVQANPDGDPCANDAADALNETTVVDLSPTARLELEALTVDTVNDEQASATADAMAAHVKLMVASVSIEASMLSAHARAVCPGPVLSSESTVLKVTVDGVAVDVPSGQAHTHVVIPGVGTLHLNEEISTGDQVVRRALWIETLPGSAVDLAAGDVVVAEAVADYHGNPCGPVTVRDGFMTGSGRVKDGTIHGVRLACDAASGPNNLQAESGGMHFHLESVGSMRCTDQPKVSAGSPAAPFDTIEGTGTGRCNGGASTATWKLTDAGEPGRNDSFSISVAGSCSFSASGTLRQGNHQAHGST